ncbi:15627_t:CDS:1, partial [Acaulospora colombiana]
NSTVARSNIVPTELNQREEDRGWDGFTSANRPCRTGMTTTSQHSTIATQEFDRVHIEVTQSLDRRPTLFSDNSTQQRKAAELKNVL